MSGTWFFYAILAAFPGLILFAMVYKYVEIWQAGRWSIASGRIVVSTTESRLVDISTNNRRESERRNFAKVVYEYQVAGRTYRCDRVTILENLGDFEVAETLARYPVGKEVLVYYNPNRREQAVLERDAPPGLWTGGTAVVAVLAALIVGSVVGVGRLAEVLRSAIASPMNAPMVTGFLVFAVFTALFAYALHKQGVRVRSWPRAAGRVVTSGVKTVMVRSTLKNGYGRWHKQYSPDVVYTYEVGGVRYTGSRDSMSWTTGSNSEDVARRAAARHPEGSAVEVRYNPENPAESTTETRMTGILLMWLFPAIFLALALQFAR
jgi:hypothetical protein